MNKKSSTEGFGKILVVDDDSGMRFCVERALEAAGYNMELAVNGQEALDLLQQTRSDNWLALITDLNMPELNGDELILAMESAEIHIPIIVVMTSDVTDERIQRIVEKMNVKTIQKPFDRGELFEALQKIPNCRKSG